MFVALPLNRNAYKLDKITWAETNNWLQNKWVLLGFTFSCCFDNNMENCNEGVTGAV